MGEMVLWEKESFKPSWEIQVMIDMSVTVLNTTEVTKGKKKKNMHQSMPPQPALIF